MFFVLGKDAWTHILTHQGSWGPADAMVWCVWAAFATLAKQTGGFAGRRYDFGVLVGVITHRGGAVGVCV